MSEHPCRIAVLGASGGIGHRVVERLLARGHAVSCQGRSGDRLARRDWRRCRRQSWARRQAAQPDHLPPLFTRRRHDDKNRQEALIAGSDLDWTVVCPAPFSDKPVSGPLQAHTSSPPQLQLSRIRCDEDADFIVTELEAPRHFRQRVFIGHP